MTTLLLFAHADPTATPPVYAPALARLDVEARFFVSHFPGLSSAYQALADHLRGGAGERILPALMAYAGAAMGPSGYERIVLSSWSAGYKLLENMLAIPADRDAIAGWVACDSGYGEPPAAIVEWAQLARDSRKLYWAGCTDIVTEPAYRSSRSFLDQVAKLAGGPSGGFKVERWGGSTAADHVAALREHGPSFVAAALGYLARGSERPAPPSSSEPPTDPSPPVEAPLGERALALAVGELGVHETPGPASTARIAEYLAGCVRSGHSLGLASDEIPWCAAFASWCAFQAAGGHSIGGAIPGAPHMWRAAVAELVADARGNRKFYDAKDWAVRPAPGDLAIWRRAGGDPRTGGPGHVGRVESVAGDMFVTIEGNHNDQVARSVHRLDEADLVGWIIYPR